MRQSLKKNIFLIFFLINVSCDFTPRIHKDALEAQELILAQKYQKAIFVYENILKEGPDKPVKVKIYYQLGDLFSINLALNQKAIHYYSKVREVTADPLWLVKSEERIAEISFKYLQDYTQSIKSYKKLSSFKPRLKSFDLYEYRLALSFLNNKEFNNAEVKFLEISKKKKHLYGLKSMYQLGHVYFGEKKWKKAIEQWSEYVKLETKRKNIIQTRFLLANAYETIEELKKAYNLYYSILGEYPNREVVQSRLNSIYQRRVARKR